MPNETNDINVAVETANVASETNASAKPFDLNEARASIENATEIKQIQEVVANVLTFADAIAKKSEEYVAKREAEAKKIAEIEKAREEAIAAQKVLQEQLAQVQNSLAELQAAQAAQAAEMKFNERMATIDETFVLNDEERALLVSEAKDLDDESFAKWLNKNKILMREKTASYISEQKKIAEEAAAKCKAEKGKKDKKCEDKDEENEEDEDKDEEEKAKKAKASEAVAAVIDSAVSNIETAGAPDNQVNTITDLKSQFASAFAETMKFGGKTIKQLKEDSEKNKK